MTLSQSVSSGGVHYKVADCLCSCIIIDKTPLGRDEFPVELEPRNGLTSVFINNVRDLLCIIQINPDKKFKVQLYRHND